MEIVLASASPRRRELLSLITEHFTVCPADADETLRDAPLGRGSHPSFPPQGRGCAGAAPERRVHRLGYHGHDRRTAPRQAEGRGRGRFHAPPSARTHPRGADRTCRAHAGRRGAHAAHLHARHLPRFCGGRACPPTLPPESRSTRPAPTASRATAHCSSRASRATITASWVCLWLRFIPFCAIFMRYKPHLPAEIPHFSATL